MTTYNCQCKKTCPGRVIAFVAENYETQVALEMSSTMARHIVYLSPADADALGDELKKLVREALRPAGDILDAEAQQ